MKFTKKPLLSVLVAIMSLLMLSVAVFASDTDSYVDEEAMCSNEIAQANAATITLNPNGGNVSPTTIVRIIGNRFGAGGNLPRPTRFHHGLAVNHVFVGWFDTSAITGGTRVHDDTIVPTSGMRTLFARWNDPVRHLSAWWPSANANTTSIPLTFNPQPPPAWQSPMNNAISNWNTRSTPINFNTVPTSNNVVSVGSLATPAYGLIQLRGSGSNVSMFSINLNSRTITNSATNLENFITSVFAHELGHAIGLRDDPVASANGSIMNGERERNELTIPTQFDVTSVNMLYSRN